MDLKSLFFSFVFHSRFKKSSYPFRLCSLLLTFCFLISSKIYAQDSKSELEEIPLNVRIEHLGTVTINSLYNDSTADLLLSATELFRFLQIKAEPSASLDSISGFMVNEKNRYLIDNRNKKISFGGKDYPVNENQLMTTGTDLFIDIQLLGKIFGLDCQFNFRSLSVNIKPNFELPAIHEMKLQQFRKNIDQLKGQIKADTTLNQQHSLWRFGMMDWAFNSTQSTSNQYNTQIWLRTGAQLLGGEANLQIYHSTSTDFSSRNLDYYWRWVDNEKKAVRQVRVGRIAPSSISSIYNPVDGISVTNASTRYRRSFGEYTITDYTEPGWTVELYVNNVIVDYKTADATGLYTFNIPLVYGSSEVMLKFYGPYGEERIQRQYLNIPFNFLPKGELEYNVSYGIVLDDNRSRFAKADAHYGVNRYLTVGGGVEYLSSIVTGKEIPYLNASIAPFRNFLLSAEYAKGVRTNTMASYRIPSGLSFELDYTRYKPEQQAILVSYLEERQATLSLPLHWKTFTAFSRLSFKQNVYRSFTYNNADITLTSYIRRVNFNISANGNWINGNNPNIYGNFGLGLPTWWGLTTRLQNQFDFTNQNFVTVRAEFEKRISQQGYLSLVGENNFRSGYRALTLAFRWTLPFSQVNFSTRLSNNDFMTTEGAQGSFGFDSGNGYMYATDRPSVGTGGLTIAAFVDINHNGKRENNEPLAPNLAVRLSGGHVIQNAKDSLIRIVGLEPYTDYLLTLNDKSLDQISYRIVHKNLRVFVSPNGFRRIDVPILPMGEVNGWVFLKEKSGRKGQERMIVNFYAENGIKVASTLTENDGGFTYLGLPPGHYLARVDSLQLAKLGMNASVANIPFEIKPDVLGDIMYDIQLFVEKPMEEQVDSNKSLPVAAKSKDIVSVSNSQNKETIHEEFYMLQMGSFRDKQNAESFAEKIKNNFRLPVSIDQEGNMFKVRMGNFVNRSEVDSFRRRLKEKGIQSFPVLKKE